MWSKHWSTFQDKVKYIQNNIVKPLRVIILQYTKHIPEIHELAKYLTPPSNKGDKYDQYNLIVHNWYFTEDEISVTKKDGLTTSM